MSRVPKIKWHRTIFKLAGHCWFCGNKAETVDHAKPRSRKGTNKDDNLLPACFVCNNLKSDTTVAEFRRIVRLLVSRRLLHLGIWKVHPRLPVTFFGEHNPFPLIYFVEDVKCPKCHTNGIRHHDGTYGCLCGSITT